jgi:hypothetical protein
MSDELERVARLHEERERLLADQIETEKRLVENVGRDYRAGVITEQQLVELYLVYRQVAAPGFADRWNGSVPATERYGRLAGIPLARLPNGPDGTWRGVFPLATSAPAPSSGIAVAYLLFDDRDGVCYAGSSDNLRARLKRHGRDGKTFRRWIAYPCSDRKAAYQLEDRLISQYQPRLNIVGVKR